MINSEISKCTSNIMLYEYVLFMDNKGRRFVDYCLLTLADSRLSPLNQNVKVFSEYFLCKGFRNN